MTSEAGVWPCLTTSSAASQTRASSLPSATGSNAGESINTTSYRLSSSVSITLVLFEPSSSLGFSGIGPLVRTSNSPPLHDSTTSCNWRSPRRTVLRPDVGSIPR